MRAPLESRIRSISRTCYRMGAGPGGEEGAGRRRQGLQSPASAPPAPAQHLAEHGAQLLAGAIVAAVGQQLLHLLLDLLLVQVPAVGVLDACARRGVWGTCREGGKVRLGFPISHQSPLSTPTSPP